MAGATAIQTPPSDGASGVKVRRRSSTCHGNRRTARIAPRRGPAPFRSRSDGCGPPAPAQLHQYHRVPIDRPAEGRQSEAIQATPQPNQAVVQFVGRFRRMHPTAFRQVLRTVERRCIATVQPGETPVPHHRHEPALERSQFRTEHCPAGSTRLPQAARRLADQFVAQRGRERRGGAAGDLEQVRGQVGEGAAAQGLGWAERKFGQSGRAGRPGRKGGGGHDGSLRVDCRRRPTPVRRSQNDGDECPESKAPGGHLPTGTFQAACTHCTTGATQNQTGGVGWKGPRSRLLTGGDIDVSASHTPG